MNMAAALTRIASRAPRRTYGLIMWSSTAVLVALIVASVTLPWLTDLRGIDPELVDLFNRSAPANATYWLGTDELGRDLLTRLAMGGRVSLGVGLLGALSAATIGTVVGLAAGYTPFDRLGRSGSRKARHRG
jgi:peptide/nickel transport system permease protein